MHHVTTVDPLIVPIFIRGYQPLTQSFPAQQQLTPEQYRYSRELLIAAGMTPRSDGGIEESSDILAAYAIVMSRPERTERAA